MGTSRHQAHVLVMLSSGCGTAYTGTVGMTLWVDNVAFVH